MAKATAEQRDEATQRLVDITRHLSQGPSEPGSIHSITEGGGGLILVINGEGSKAIRYELAVVSAETVDVGPAEQERMREGAEEPV